ncbi:MAG: sulfite exporter TauE/SafE family protein [Myxococcales bacterium]|nr:sulfite exporter TauE/SafE family protein [Myxococcales bacterium]
MSLAILLILGFLCWFLSSVAAGGGAILFLPTALWVLEPKQLPVVIAIASAISSVQRVALYRGAIHRNIWLANLPGLALGALVGALLLRGIAAKGLGYLVGGFLVVLSVHHFLGGSLRFARPRPVAFGAASFVTATTSTLVGASGPLMNPLYVGSGVVKEAMIGTKAASTLFMQFAKLAAFFSFGLLSNETWIAGCAVGVGALAGNLLGKRALRALDARRFVHFVYAALLVSGGSILWRTATG